MITDERRKVSKDFARIYESLQKSMNEAGGSMYSIDGLLNMTAFDLLCDLSPNSIRFTYTTGSAS